MSHRIIVQLWLDKIALITNFYKIVELLDLLDIWEDPEREIWNPWTGFPLRFSFSFFFFLFFFDRPLLQKPTVVVCKFWILFISSSVVSKWNAVEWFSCSRSRIFFLFQKVQIMLTWPLRIEVHQELFSQHVESSQQHPNAKNILPS